MDARCAALAGESGRRGGEDAVHGENVWGGGSSQPAENACGPRRRFRLKGRPCAKRAPKKGPTPRFTSSISKNWQFFNPSRTSRIFRTRAAKVVAVVVSVALAAGILPSALAAVEWPATIQRFERLNPVESLVLDCGADQDELSLPSSLRALVPLSAGFDVSAFEQIVPTADISDGYETYDYYSFGYIAPSDASDLYEKGERVVYRITYATRDIDGKATNKVGEVAYRVYGTMGGDEAAWYACNEAGIPNARIVDVPVSWDASTVDLSTPGNYTANASFSGWSYFGAAPCASVTVQEAKECTCGAGADAEEHAEDCPLHDEARESTVSDDVQDLSSSDVVDVDAAVEAAETSEGKEADEEVHCTCDAGDGALRHEQGCALYAEPCGQECRCAEDGGPIEAANFPWAHDDGCPYYSPVECMCREKIEVEAEQESCDGTGGTTTGTVTETIPGDYSHVHDPDNVDCPLHGRDVVEVSKAEAAQVAAAAIEADIAKVDDLAASSTATANLATDGAWGTSEMTWMAVDDVEATVSAQEANAGACSALGEISLTGKARTADGAETSVASSVSDDMSSLLGAKAANASTLDGSGAISLVGGFFSGVTETIGSLFGAHEAQAAGTRDTVVNKCIQDNTPTSGNADASYYSSSLDPVIIPGSWLDYVNTTFMNKGFNKFSWQADADCAAQGNWKWGGTTASQTTGTVTTNALRIPVKSGTTWTVYSGEQLRYALSNFASGDTVKLGSNLNLNGANYDWSTLAFSGGNVTFDGNGKIMYNLGRYDLLQVDTASAGSYVIYAFVFYSKSSSITLKNLTFEKMRRVSFISGKRSVRDISNFQPALFGGTTVPALTVEGLSLVNPMFWQLETAEVGDQRGCSFGAAILFNGGSKDSTYSRCSVRGAYIYATSHLNPMGTGGNGSKDSDTGVVTMGVTFSNSYVVDSLFCTVGVHSAGFQGCSGFYYADVRQCFVSAEFYCAYVCGGFGGFSTYCTDCFSTGKLEGYARIAGFRFSDADSGLSNIRCYSTMLVGTRSNPDRQGGFKCDDTYTDGRVESMVFADCYAAGEVANFDVDMEGNANKCGGFVSTTDATNFTISNCYYDKQMTAMREWASGDQKSVTGVTGVLTSSTDKAGTGLASGTYGSSGDAGFRGFSDNSKWVYAAGRYPQLAAFANATASAWGSAEVANMVKAYSLASTATVALDTWDSGYTWDADGVRSAEKSSWSGTGGDHAGGLYTYDTVREMVSTATVTSGATFSHQVDGGLKTSVADVDADPQTSSLEGPAVVSDASTGTLSPNVPGVDWAYLSCAYSGQSARRPLRLATMAAVEAGSDVQVSDGALYDHRDGVELTAIDTNIDDLVVGTDDAKAWATAKRSGYPDKSVDPAYYKVEAQNISGTLSATNDLLLYTDVRRLKQDANGGLATDSSGSYIEDGIIVDLRAGDDGANARAMWAGKAAMRAGVSFGRAYKVTYYLLASDGRYRSDSKTVTVSPTSYAASVCAWDSSGSSALASALHLGGAADTVSDTGSTPDFSVSDSTVSAVSTGQIPYGRNATLSWKRDDEHWHVSGAKLTFSDKAGNSYSATVDGELSAGSTVSVTGVPYVSASYAEIAGRSDGLCRETWTNASVTLTYAVQEDEATSTLYLRLNKLANAPSFAKGEVGYPGEATSALLGGDATGISATDAYVNDMQYDVTLDLYVVEDVPFSFTKTASDSVTPLAGATFALYACGNSAHTKASDHSKTASNDAGCCWEVDDAVATKTSGDDGLVDFGTLATGQYMLVETAAPSGYALPHGQWMLDADSAAHTISITARGDDLPPAFKKDAETGAYSVANYKKWTLPLAGGTGIIAFTAAGAALVAAACAWLLFARRKKRAV